MSMQELIEKHYRIEATNHFAAISIAINDIGVFHDHFNKTITKKLGINQFVNKGDNVIRVDLWIPQDMEILPHSLDCSICVAEYSGVAGNFTKKVLQQIDWAWKDGTAFPVHLEEAFVADADFPRWTWLDGDVISPETLDKKSLYKYIADFHKIMVEKNYSLLAPLLKTKAKELAAALYIPLSEQYLDEEKFFQDIFSDPAFEMRPMDWEGLVIRHHANNRLIEIIDRKGSPAIYSTPFRDDTAFGIELFLAFKNGEWILCR